MFHGIYGSKQRFMAPLICHHKTEFVTKSNDIHVPPQVKILNAVLSKI